MDLYTRLVGVLERHSGWVILTGLIITLLLMIPLLLMAPEDEASQDPGGEVFDLRSTINDQLAPSVHITPFIIESPTQDLFTQAALWELFQNEEKLREMDTLGELAPEGLPKQPYLFSTFEPKLGFSFVGVFSVADGVQLIMEKLPEVFGDTTLETATDDEVKVAINWLWHDRFGRDLLSDLSVKAEVERRTLIGQEIIYWNNPAAFTFGVVADNELLGGGSFDRTGGGGEVIKNKEEFNRIVQRVLRGEQENYDLWGLAIDLNIESVEEGETAGIFIVLTVISAVLIVGFSLRSYWVTALTGTGLAVITIWLKGMSNLVGLKGGLIIELIVPIAMISLGVDFAVHAIRHYQVEKRIGYPPRRALGIGLAGVFSALVLAMLSDSIAFLSNTSSQIESVRHFGEAAAIATVSSFVVLGIILPLTLMRVDLALGSRDWTITGSIQRISVSAASSVGVAAFAGLGVILLVAVNAALGLGVIAAFVVGFVVIPLLWVRWRDSRSQDRQIPENAADERSAKPGDDIAERFSQAPEDVHRLEDLIETVVVWLARRRIIALVVAAIVTGLATLLALRLEATLEPRDFFDGNSDFVISVDKLDEHVGDEGGESAVFVIQGDLTSLEGLAALKGFETELRDNSSVAHTPEGSPVISERTVFDLLKELMRNEYPLEQVAAMTGVELTDEIRPIYVPDTAIQLKAAYDYMIKEGVPRDEDQNIFTAGQVAETLFHDPTGIEENITSLSVEVVNTKEQTAVIEARKSLTDALKFFDGIPEITKVGLTGAPFTRQAQLDSTTKALQVSIPLAAAGAFILLLLAMRSVRFAVVTIIPIGLVVVWLYGLMSLMGFPLNFVTATIGAISVGVGIDFSIHMTIRFRQELRKDPDRMDALRRAARATGVGLVAAAASSIVGFAIMGFAPMPLFAAYGLLTALMIFLALVASLVVLPSLLMLVAPKEANQSGSTAVESMPTSEELTLQRSSDNDGG